MSAEFLLKGWIVGFVIASPIGPVGVLCIRRTLAEGRLVGLMAVLGAATADAFYGMIAALGLTAVSRVLMAHRLPLLLGSGLFLLYLGAVILRARPAAPAEGERAASLPAAYFGTLLLMLANPLIIVSFLAVFAAFRFETSGIGDLPAAWLAAGLFLGSAAWWIVFSLAAKWFRPRIRGGGLRAVNLASGSLMCAFGAWQLGRFFLNLHR